MQRFGEAWRFPLQSLLRHPPRCRCAPPANTTMYLSAPSLSRASMEPYPPSLPHIAGAHVTRVKVLTLDCESASSLLRLAHTTLPLEMVCACSSRVVEALTYACRFAVCSLASRGSGSACARGKRQGRARVRRASTARGPPKTWGLGRVGGTLDTGQM